MSFMIIHLNSTNEVDPELNRLNALYLELDKCVSNDEYVALTHESDWSLSAYANGTLVWENNLDADHQSYHMENVPKEKVLELWGQLSKGYIASIADEPWLSTELG